MAFINDMGMTVNDGFYLPDTNTDDWREKLNRSFIVDSGKSIDAVVIYPDNSGFEIVYRRKSNFTYACHPPRNPPDEVWKDVYLAGVQVDSNNTFSGKISFSKTIRANVEPAHQVGEKIIWPENKEKN